MADQLQLRGGTTAEHSTFTGALREVTVDTDKDVLVVHDNATAGGHPLMAEDGSNSALALGSAGTPSLKFTGDTNTGVFSPGADQLAVSTAGVERVEFGTTEAVFNDGGADYNFRVEGDTNANLVVVDASADSVGIGTDTPGTLIEIDNAAPYVTLKNNTHEDTDGGRESRLIFEGEQTGGEISTLAQIEVSHDGTGDDQQGKLVISTNDGANGATPTAAVTIDSSQRVGVGTTSPSTLLHLETSGTGNAELTVKNNNASPGSGRILFADQGASDAGVIQYEHDVNAMVFKTNTAEAARIDSSGRVGIGTSSPDGRITVQRASNNQGISGGIAFKGQDGTTHGGVGTDGVNTNNLQILAAQGIYFHTGNTDGTANIRATLDSSGRLGIGDSAPDALLVIKGNSDSNTTPSIRLKDGTDTREAWITNSAGDLALNVGGDDNVPHGTLKLFEGGTLSYTQAAGERARIDSSGRLLVGTSTARTNFNTGGNTAEFQVEGVGKGSFMRNLNDQYGSDLFLTKSRSTGNSIVSNNDIVGNISFQGNDGTNFVPTAIISAQIDGTPGTNDMPGRLVFSTTADGASSPTERMRITSDGFVTNKTSNIGSITGVGWSLGAGTGELVLTKANASPLYINRTGNDGDLISFYQDGLFEGGITVSGSTISYNGAHLSRWSQLPGGVERTEILRGSVLSNIDEMCEWDEEANEQLNRMKVSDVEGDKNVAGVFQAWDDDDDTYTNDFYCAMTGDFVIRIGAGVTVERGDLLMSAGDGTAKPQDDDIIRSKTIAKVTSTNVSCTYDDGSYCVPCVLMVC